MAAPGLRRLTPNDLAILGAHAAKHGEVLRSDMQLADSDGGIAVPFVRLGTLAQLERRGTLGLSEAGAGELFNRLFQNANLDGLKAADMGRVPVTSPVFGDISDRSERARRRISDAIVALGGYGSTAASIVWHVCGLEWSVARWSQVTRRRPDQATGILVGALSALSAHFADRRFSNSARPGGP